ncbi:cell wall protein [Nocardiopsis sp. NPDC006832]|uniref:cell wall protein n=1 Tax=Nocardiopsis sp. NPDC006832 TaxID=3157188 RepID=UPI00340BDCD8
MRAAVPLRGLVPPLATVAAATLLVAGAPSTVLAEPIDEPVHPRTTTVNRTQGLDPEGDSVTVAGIGHTPGSRIEITTRAVPAEARGTDEVDETAVLDDDNTVTTDVDERGLFGVTLDTGVDFAAEAGLDTEEDPFEIVVLDAEPPERTDEVDGTGESVEPTDDGVVSDPGAGMSAPVLAPVSPAVPAVVAAVPVVFAVPAAVPENRPQSASRSAPQAAPHNAPQALPRTPGDLSLSVSKTSGIDPDGETVTVTGSGYDTAKGIYVALCDTANAGSSVAPGPCIGGVDMEGEGGSSAWISSNPPPYGEGLATPYTGGGTDGGFTVELAVKAKDDNTDCTAAGTECAVVTRNDHTRSSDRGQDEFVPVTFAGQAGDGGGGSGDGSGSDEGAGSGSGGGGASGGSGAGGASGSGSGSGSGGSGGDGPLALTGAPLAGLLLTAVVASLAGVTALVATRRRAGGTDPTTA